MRYAIVGILFLLGGLVAGGAVTAALADGPGDSDGHPVAGHMQAMGEDHAAAHAAMAAECDSLMADMGAHPHMQ